MKRIRFIFPLLLTIIFSLPAIAATNFGTTSPMPQSIPDNNAAGVCVNFTVSGLSAGIQSVSLNLGLNHSWIGDLTAIVKSPNNTRSIKLFEKIDDGADDSDTAGNFNFTDSATANFWTSAINSSSAVPVGNYRTVDLNGNATSLNTTFYNLQPNQANGIWQLCTADENVFDTGEITSATLGIEVFAPTATSANITGRVISPAGRGISRATVKLIATSNSQVYRAATNSFGNFRLSEIPVGETYILSVEHKSYRFENRTITLQEDLEGLEIRSVKQ
jgi:subtilisin-like proprotein convertase family protein